jgi:hypothetical protein
MTDSRAAMLRSFFSIPFLLCGVTLLAAVVGLRPVLAGLTQGLSKETIALRKSLDEFDVSQLSAFRRVLDGGFFPKPVSAYVGTEDVISWTFELRELGPQPPRELDVMLFITYYSNPRDTVPHTPEVCYRQAGAVVNSVKAIPVEIPGLGPEHASIDAALLNVTPVMLNATAQQEAAPWRQALIYTFVCNGEFYPGREQVRLAIGLPGDRYSYFSKVEVSSACAPGEDFDEAVERCRQMLREALPILVSDHYPTKEDLRGP